MATGTGLDPLSMGAVYLSRRLVLDLSLSCETKFSGLVGFFCIRVRSVAPVSGRSRLIHNRDTFFGTFSVYDV